jgi:hypothetical protein
VAVEDVLSRVRAVRPDTASPAEVRLLVEAVDELFRVNTEQALRISQLEAELCRLKKVTPHDPRRAGGGNQTGCAGKGSSGGSLGTDRSSERERRKGETRRPWKKKPRTAIPIDAEVELTDPPPDLPDDARRDGYEERTFQDLVLMRWNIRFRRARWFSRSTGKTYLAPLPPGYQGDFGPGLAVLAPTLVYSTNMGQRDLVRLCREYDLQISAGTISRKVTGGLEWLRSEFEAAVRAAWEFAPFCSTDHTKTRVAGVPHTTQVFEDPLCTFYCTLAGANRRAVIQGLRLGLPHQYRLDQLALGLMERWGIPQRVRRRLAGITVWPAEGKAFCRHLDLCFPLLPNQQREAILAACALAATRADAPAPLPALLLSDAASVFNDLVAVHGLCWVHEGRHYQELNPLFDHYRRALKRFRGRFWKYYRRLQAYRMDPDAQTADRLEAEFDRLFSTKTCFPDLAHCMEQTRSRKDKLLQVLKYPVLPLHTNATELAVRRRVRRRDISFGPQSQAGLRAWDLMQGLAATLAKHGLTVRGFLHDRVLEQREIPPLPAVIRETAQRLAGSSWAT